VRQPVDQLVAHPALRSPARSVSARLRRGKAASPPSAPTRPLGRRKPASAAGGRLNPRGGMTCVSGSGCMIVRRPDGPCAAKAQTYAKAIARSRVRGPPSDSVGRPMAIPEPRRFVRQIRDEISEIFSTGQNILNPSILEMVDQLLSREKSPY
jgi:hypothetical protein